MRKIILNRILCTVLSGIMLSAIVTGCAETASTAESSPGEPSKTEAAETETKAEEGNASVANPWVEITGDEAHSLCPRLFKAPDGASGIRWSKLNGSEGDSSIEAPLVQLDFTLDGMDFCARAQAGAKENADISGMYYDWTVSISRPSLNRCMIRRASLCDTVL